MASVDWLKATTQKAGAMIKHNGKEERIKNNHSNTDIDTSKSHLNFYIGADDYAPMLEKVKARIKEVDELYPPKRNLGAKRITCIMLETPVPQAIEEQGRAKEFLEETHKVIEDFFGAENVGGTVCHFDEQHKYPNKDCKEQKSLIHAHTLCCAYAEWTEKKKNKQTGEITTIERKGINGKNCETLARLHALNDKMQEMCLERFGVSFNTGETPQRKSVERLKNESELREEEFKLKKSITNLETEREEIKNNILEYEEPTPKKLIESNKAYQERIKPYQQLQLAKELTDKQQQLQAELTAREQALHQNELEYEKKKKSLEKELQQAYDKGYAVGCDTGKIKGQTEQQKEDKAKIEELEKTIEKQNKQIQEMNYDFDVINDYLKENNLNFDNVDDVIDYQKEKNWKNFD